MDIAELSEMLDKEDAWCVGSSEACWVEHRWMSVQRPLAVLVRGYRGIIAYYNIQMLSQLTKWEDVHEFWNMLKSLDFNTLVLAACWCDLISALTPVCKRLDRARVSKSDLEAARLDAIAIVELVIARLKNLILNGNLEVAGSDRQNVQDRTFLEDFLSEVHYIPQERWRGEFHLGGGALGSMMEPFYEVANHEKAKPRISLDKKAPRRCRLLLKVCQCLKCKIKRGDVKLEKKKRKRTEAEGVVAKKCKKRQKKGQRENEQNPPPEENPTPTHQRSTREHDHVVQRRVGTARAESQLACPTPVESSQEEESWEPPGEKAIRNKESRVNKSAMMAASLHLSRGASNSSKDVPQIREPLPDSSSAKEFPQIREPLPGSSSAKDVPPSGEPPPISNLSKEVQPSGDPVPVCAGAVTHEKPSLYSDSDWDGAPEFYAHDPGIREMESLYINLGWIDSEFVSRVVPALNECVESMSKATVFFNAYLGGAFSENLWYDVFDLSVESPAMKRDCESRIEGSHEVSKDVEVCSCKNCISIQDAKNRWEAMRQRSFEDLCELKGLSILEYPWWKEHYHRVAVEELEKKCVHGSWTDSEASFADVWSRVLSLSLGYPHRIVPMNERQSGPENGNMFENDNENENKGGENENEFGKHRPPPPRIICIGRDARQNEPG